MIALMACGLVAEPVLGHARLAALYFASGVIGALLHVEVAPESTISLVGASGAICGVMERNCILHSAPEAPGSLYQVGGY